MSSVSKAERRLRRQSRVRKKIRGSSEMPRLCVSRSNKNVYAQIIDDTVGTHSCGGFFFIEGFSFGIGKPGWK